MIDTYEIDVRTVKGDSFKGRYAMLPGRREVVASILRTTLEAPVVDRLAAVVRRVINWPKVITAKRLEVAVEDRRRIGTIVFSHTRTNRIEL